MMRRHWIDNLRWVTVLLVLFYHVIYFYNNKGVIGGIGGFDDGPQYQDVVMYVLYPWFMPLLFLLAGVSARYWVPLVIISMASGAWLVCTTFGEANTTPQYLSSVPNCVFGWFAGLGYMLKIHTTLPPLAIYIILTMAVFTLSPLMYEGIKRIPVVRWCVLGEVKK